jgi:hypothetical protein
VHRYAAPRPKCIGFLHLVMCWAEYVLPRELTGTEVEPPISRERFTEGAEIVESPAAAHAAGSRKSVRDVRRCARGMDVEHQGGMKKWPNGVDQ